jgi:hypothetical protein
MPVSAAHLEAIDRLERELLEAQYQARRLSLWLTLRFNPDQPRVPAGQPDGGQWTAEGARVIPAQELLLGPGGDVLFGRTPPWIQELIDGGAIPDEVFDQPREPIPGQSGKEAATDVPSWVRESGEVPSIRQSGEQFSKNVMDEKYSRGNWEKSKIKEYQQIKKWGDRHFRIPKWFIEKYGTT